MDFTTIILIILFLFGLGVAYWIGFRSGSFRKDREWEKELPSYRKDAISKSRAVLSGLFSEQLAPFLPDFNYNPTECRFIGKPIDFICFRGLDKKDVDEVVFVEVKSGNSKLSPTEKKLKEAIDKKKVRWEEYRVSKELTDVEDIEEVEE
ncbi:MAG: Holliday junction resolvase-like protein [archaeon]